MVYYNFSVFEDSIHHLRLVLNTLLTSRRPRTLLMPEVRSCDVGSGVWIPQPGQQIGAVANTLVNKTINV